MQTIRTPRREETDIVTVKQEVPLIMNTSNEMQLYKLIYYS
jgi:hypothetical protein